jgi:hypothetical protein
VVTETLTATGSLLVSGNTFGASIQTTGAMHILGNTGCAMAGCGAFAAALGTAIPGTWACSTVVAGCDCTSTNVSITNATNGTYVIQSTGHALVNGNENWLYCVEGGGITLRKVVENAFSPIYVGDID